MRLLFLLLLLTSFLFSADCTGYSEDLHIRVVDSSLRPIEGAKVQVTFDRGTSFGEKYFTTEPKETDENGSVFFTLLNQGTTTRKIDCNIYITAWFGPTSTKSTIVALAHPRIVDVKLPVYQVKFYVRNQNGKALANATIFYVNETKKTNDNGAATFYSGKGEAEYLVSYMSGTESGFVSVSGDTTREVIIPEWDVVVEVYDDNGRPLNGTINYAKETIATQEGKAAFKVYKDYADIEVVYENLRKSILLNAKEKPNEKVYFDLNPPTISDPTYNISNKRVKMAFEIKDNGVYASGVDPATIRITYRILPAGQQQKTKTYSLGGNMYGIDFPEVEEGTIVEFSAQASDYEGNSAYREGRFLIKKQGSEDSSTGSPQGENESKKSGNQQENEGKKEENTFIYVIIVILLVIFGGYLLKKFMEAKQNSEKKQNV